MTEQEIISGCKKGDRLCQNALYEKYFPLMSNIALRYCDEHDAISLINKGFLKVLQKIDSYNSTYSMATWIRTILVRTIINHNRDEHRRVDFANMKEAEWQHLTFNTAESKLQVNDLLLLLRNLPKTSAKVFNLFVVDGFNHKEISEMLGIKRGTSKWHLAEARRLLKQALEYQEMNEKKMEVLKNEA